MSDYSISFVPKQSIFPNPQEKANEIFEWLVSKDIIKPFLSDCILSSQKGFSISDGAKKVCLFPNDLPFNLRTNGVEIITERQVFDTGENGIEELICPICGVNIAVKDWDLNSWDSGGSDNIKCTNCDVESEINKFHFSPEWGFSNLGFTFWNWPEFNTDFIKEFEQKMGCTLTIVYQHI
ncbi:MAG TPA: hypothetical protein VD908_07870 [Cytophagales bacterium]|nr:hypothetical protein [Cytophagales bacterium]